MLRDRPVSKLLKLAVAALLIGCTLSAAAAVAQDAAVNAPVRAPIQGGIQLDETLPGLPGPFKVGDRFEEPELQGLTPDNIWFAIPAWLAGKWHGDVKTVDYAESFRTGVKNVPHLTLSQPLDTVHGHQRDRTGQIWDFIEIPRWASDGRLPRTRYLRLLREEPLQSDSSQVVLKDLHNQMLVNSDSHLILSSIQVEQIGTYTPLQDGLVKVEASLKNYDDAGNPIMLQRQSMLLQRTAPYEDIDSLHGLDLKRMFIEYLKKIGRQDLLPI